MYQGRASRRSAQVARSQVAVRFGLAIYAAACVAVLLRCLVLILSLPETVWAVGTILSTSQPIVLPFSVLPAATRAIFGSATLSDLTAALLLVALPLPFMGRQSRST